MPTKRPKQSELKNLKPMLGGFTLSKSDLFLDAGCGYGARTIELSKEVGAHVISIDFSSDCLNDVKKQKEELGLDSVDLIRADLQHIPLKDGCIDVIVSGDVLEHIPQVSKTVSDFYRLIKCGGLVFLLVPSKVTQKLYFKLDDAYGQKTGHVRIFEAKEFKGLILNSGFSIISDYYSEFFRSIYHLLQVLTKTNIEHHTGRVINERNAVSIIWSISRLVYYSSLGDLIEEFGKYLFPNSYVVIAVKD